MRSVFLSYARKDLVQATRLYEALADCPDLSVWFDQKDLLPGVAWKPAIRRAIREADCFLALLSANAVTKRGFRHSELQEALKVKNEFPEEMVYLIPVRLDRCNMPFAELSELNYADLFPDWDAGVNRIMVAMGVVTEKADPTEQIRAKSAKTHPVLEYEYRVGLADLDGQFTNLSDIAGELNDVQKFFHFTTTKLKSPSRAVGKIEESRNLKIFRIPKAFYTDPELLSVDYVVCLSKELLAFEEDDDVYYNYIGYPAPENDRFMFVSTAGLYKYGREAGVKFEVAVVQVVTSMLVAHFFDWGFHYELRACPMDFTEDHRTIVPALRKGQFCTACGKVLSQNEAVRDAVMALVRWGR